jgi:hypothetical protein
VIDEPATLDRRVRGLRMELDVHGVGGRVDTAAVDEPADTDVLRAVAALDRHGHTELTLIAADGAYLTVGEVGGSYHVWMGSVEHDDRIVLQDPREPCGSLRLVVGGRGAAHPAHDVVDLATATDAVREFLRTGLPHPYRPWRSA